MTTPELILLNQIRKAISDAVDRVEGERKAYKDWFIDRITTIMHNKGML